MKWYKRDPDAYFAGTRMLTLEERGAYNDLIELLYSRDGDVPDDDCFMARSLICRPQVWRRIKMSLLVKGKIRSVASETGMKLMANRVETALKEAANFSETQSKRATEGWVSRKKLNENNSLSLPLGNANTTTTTTTSILEELESTDLKNREGVAPQQIVAAPQKQRLGMSPDKGNDYRAPPAQKSDNELKPIPDRSKAKGWVK